MPSTPATTSVHRIEVSAAPGQSDPIGQSVARDAAAIGFELDSARATHVYLVQAALTERQVERLRERLLTDPVTETSRIGAAPVAHGTRIVEVHPLPGVMDPVAESVQMVIGELLGLDEHPQVSTGWRYDFKPKPGSSFSEEQARSLANRLLANTVIQRVVTQPFHPTAFPAVKPHDHAVRSIELINLTDEQLTRLSREAHLFLTLEEMRAIQSHYRSLGRDPRDIELETLAQTWSEHCVHKTLKSTISYRSDGATKRRSDEVGGHQEDPIRWSGRPGHEIQPDGTIVIRNLLKSTVAAATHKLIADGLDWTLSVFVDNSGVIAFDEKHAVCVKVETHNHPSAIEPYGGAATGVGGCIRDVIGTGLGARPIANTDVFCVAMPDGWSEPGAAAVGQASRLPQGCLHPRRILSQVVAGVRDYGNRMGIPTVSGAVYFDDRYVGNPLVFCGCIGVMPRTHVKGKVQPGDLIVALGGRTGRDGIHGATFSSAELEHSAADEFSHAVQIGNAITEKRVLDAIMRAASASPVPNGGGGPSPRGPEGEKGGAHPLFNAMTDCGAGGFSSAIGELGKDTGAIVHLDRAPLKYAGLSYTEIWISEAQERMVLAVPPKNLAALERICREESVELAVLGEFSSPPFAQAAAARPKAHGAPADLQLLFHNLEVGRLSMHFLHHGIPTPVREATWPPAPSSAAPTTRQAQPKRTASDIGESLLSLLAHPNIASKHWIIRQYDHEVRGSTAIKPLVGPAPHRGPGDASVILPVPGSTRGLAIACGLQTGIGDPLLDGDPYLMTLAAIDECVRNLVCSGADPSRIAILDNFCWPSCAKPQNLGSLVRAAEGCYDGALAYRTPFVSGKDSLNNQFTTQDGRTIEIPPTLLITGIGIVPDVRRCCTSDAKEPGNTLLVVGATGAEMGGSHYQQIAAALDPALRALPHANLKAGPATAHAIFKLIQDGLVRSAHDCSDGGLLTAIAEMLIGGSTQSQPLGARVQLAAAPLTDSLRVLSDKAFTTLAAAFAETPSRYVLEVRPADLSKATSLLAAAGIPHAVIGMLDASGTLTLADTQTKPIPVEILAAAWLKPLDW